MAITNNKMKTLLARKQRILRDLQYVQSRIDEFNNQQTSYEYDDGSDSDTEFTLDLDNNPGLPALKSQQAMLKICLQATQELNSLEILETEVNIMVEEPKFDGSLVNEVGIWREVTAECCIDLVPFLISFFMHTTERPFAPTTFRGLRVRPLKRAHEVELTKSVLPGLTRPSDAVEVIHGYALAQRSRRACLARLADRFAANLHMDPLPDGGYQLKCAGLLELSWTLENKWSPIAAFHHRMRFDLEYMDESYIKSISLAHRQLSDPRVDTEERIQLLSKIFSTCLEARGPEPDSYSESEAGAPGRSTTLDEEPDEPDEPQMKKAKEDHEVMAPPKYLPKKTKPKGKENKAENVTQMNALRKTADKVENVKKRKIEEDNNTSNKRVATDVNRVATTKNDVDVAISNNPEAANVASNKNSGATGKIVKKVARNKVDVKNPVQTEHKEIEVAQQKVIKSKSDTNLVKEKAAGSVASDKNKVIRSKSDINLSKNITSAASDDNAVVKKKIAKKQISTDKSKHVVKKTATNGGLSSKPGLKARPGVIPGLAFQSNSDPKSKVDPKGNPNSKPRDVKANAASKTTLNSNKPGLKTNQDPTTKGDLKVKADSRTKSDPNIVLKAKLNPQGQTDLKSNADLKAKTNLKARSDLKANADLKAKIVKPVDKNKPHLKTITKSKSSTGNIKPRVSTAGKTTKDSHASQKTSKIPQKLSSNSEEKLVKKNPQRISPRKTVSKAGIANKMPLVSDQKSATNIPRLLPKPKPKIP